MFNPQKCAGPLSCPLLGAAAEAVIVTGSGLRLTPMVKPSVALPPSVIVLLVLTPRSTYSEPLIANGTVTDGKLLRSSPHGM